MPEMKDPRKTFGEALLEAAEGDGRILALSADSSGSSGMGPFKKRFPGRHIEFGIMEQGVIGYAAGLATAGWLPFVSSIAPFVTSRVFEMIRNDLGYMRQNVKVVGRNAGLTYPDLGPTHQSLEDVAILRTIPGMVVLNPGDPREIRSVVRAAARHEGPVYIRIGALPMPVLLEEGAPFEIGRGAVLRQGGDVALIGSGTALCRAWEAAGLLEQRGIRARLINLPTLKPLDRPLIVAAARETGAVVTVEEHYLAGGLGSAVAEVLAAEQPTRMRMIGVDDRFASNGPYEELLGLYGLQGRQIADTVAEFLRA